MAHVVERHINRNPDRVSISITIQNPSATVAEEQKQSSPYQIITRASRAARLQHLNAIDNRLRNSRAAEIDYEENINEINESRAELERHQRALREQFGESNQSPPEPGDESEQSASSGEVFE